MNVEVKGQLMAMAGITDVEEFDNLVEKLVPSAKQTLESKIKHSPFSVPLIKMLAIFEERQVYFKSVKLILLDT